MSLTTASPTSGNLAGLLLETAEGSYRLLGNSPEAVIQLNEWSPVPGAPDYVLGTTDHKQQIYTIIDPDRLSPTSTVENQSSVPSGMQASRIGLVIADEGTHSYILLGHRVRSAPASVDTDWTDLEFPKSLFLAGYTQTPTRIQRTADRE